MFESTWSILQWPILQVLSWRRLFAIIYCYAPATKRPFKLFTPGAVIALVAWLVFTLLFSFYVNTFGSFNKTYGTLAGVIVLLLYFYYSAFILLMGAQVNQVVESDSRGESNSVHSTLPPLNLPVPSPRLTTIPASG